MMHFLCLILPRIIKLIAFRLGGDVVPNSVYFSVVRSYILSLGLLSVAINKLATHGQGWSAVVDS